MLHKAAVKGGRAIVNQCRPIREPGPLPWARGAMQRTLCRNLHTHLQTGSRGSLALSYKQSVGRTVTANSPSSAAFLSTLAVAHRAAVSSSHRRCAATHALPTMTIQASHVFQMGPHTLAVSRHKLHGTTRTKLLTAMKARHMPNIRFFFC